jgi:hypothetical protein
MGSGFFNIFNEIVPQKYKNNWDMFQRDKIELRLDAIFESFLNIEDSVEGNFDAFPHFGTVSTVGLASMLLMIYSSYEQAQINEKKDYLIKPTRLLIDRRISEKGWPYYHDPDENEQHAQTLSTWLSMAVLKYIPEEIGNEITDHKWDEELEKIKSEVKNWLMSTKDLNNGYCSWSFRPGESDDRNMVNPVATAQAILALHYCTEASNEGDDDINRAIEYIKSKKSDMRDEGELYKTERLVRPIDMVTHVPHPGVQQCIQALLIYDTSTKDGVVQNLLNEVINMVPHLSKGVIDRCSYYAALRPLLLSLPSTRRMVLLDSSASISEFKSFVSGAKSITLVGELCDAHAKLIPNDAQVTILCQAPYEKTLPDTYGWESNFMSGDAIHALGAINCIIVDGEKALLSRDPFKDMGRYNFHKYLKGGEVSDLIKQLENSTNIEIPINGGDIKQEILDKLSEFPNHCEIIEPELEKMETEGLQGILEYVSLNPKYAEGAELASALGLEGRESVERELSEKGVFSRIFVNSKLKNLMEHSMFDDNDNPLVLDESSAYLILNCGDNKEKILKKCLAGIEEFYVTSDIYDKIEAHLGAAQHRILKKIEDKDNKYIDAFESLQEALPNYHFNENEKIEIGFIITKGVGEIGIITNSWEVTKTCKENNIRTFSLMKFLDKNADTYKLFRIPVDKVDG